MALLRLIGGFNSRGGRQPLYNGFCWWNGMRLQMKMRAVACKNFCQMVDALAQRFRCLVDLPAYGSLAAGDHARAAAFSDGFKQSLFL